MRIRDWSSDVCSSDLVLCVLFLRQIRFFLSYSMFALVFCTPVLIVCRHAQRNSSRALITRSEANHEAPGIESNHCNDHQDMGDYTFVRGSLTPLVFISVNQPRSKPGFLLLKLSPKIGKASCRE